MQFGIPMGLGGRRALGREASSFLVGRQLEGGAMLGVDSSFLWTAIIGELSK